MDSSASHNIKAYTSIVSGVMIQLVAGAIFITGNICIYFSSLLQNHNYKVTTKELNILVPFQVLGLTLSLSLGPYLTYNFSPRISLIISASIALTSILLSTLLINFYLIVFTYGFCYGFGCGIMYITPLIVCWSHFPQYKGRITGIILTGFGFSPAIFNIIITQLVNPDNKQASVKIGDEFYFDEDVSNNLMPSLRILAFIYLVLLLISLFLIDNSKISTSNDQGEMGSLSMSQIIRTKNFWLMCMMAFCSICSGFYIVGNYKIFGQYYIQNDKFLAAIGSAGSITDGSLRFFWGVLLDCTSFKKAYGFMLVLEIASLICIFHAVAVKEVYAAFVGIIWSTKGGHYVLFTPLCGNLYGKQNGSRIFGLVSYFIVGGTFFGVLIQKAFLDFLGYEKLFYVFAGLTSVSLFLLLAFDEKKNVDVPASEIPLLGLKSE